MRKSKETDLQVLERVLVGSIMSPIPGPEFRAYLMKEYALGSLENSVKALGSAASSLSKIPSRKELDRLTRIAKAYQDLRSGTTAIWEMYKQEDQALHDLPLDQRVWPQLRPQRAENSRSTENNQSESSHLKVGTASPDREEPLRKVADQYAPFGDGFTEDGKLIIKGLSDDVKAGLKVLRSIGLIPTLDGYEVKIEN